MEPQIIDYIFWILISAIVLGGLACMMIFLPREHDYESKCEGCYRIQYRDGVYSISHKKPTYGENNFSIRSKYFYIKRVPFETNAICDDAGAGDGKSYRAAAQLKLCFPEDKLQVFAPTFHGVAHEVVVETLEEALSSAMGEAIGVYSPDADMEDFNKQFKEIAQKKLDIFGAYIMHINGLKITENV